jgi:ATP-dependent RNA helicase SUPV3L1/SUV3
MNRGWAHPSPAKSPLVLVRIGAIVRRMAVSNPDNHCVTAVLGPTNTGKTHLAVERLCAHSSGVMGFPLRLLAREVYDRVVAIKGPKEVGLVTGEEKILPDGARWLLCTAESMPTDRDVAFVAIDEGQLGADPERGHVFTDRILRARGREETMILGSESLRPIVRGLVPDAEIITRPRFSKLSYAGAKKLSRLPPRSAIVAFSAEQVYAVAEMLRRARGGAAVVMGALSPRTRNAQVAMYQAGEVDYLVATDAIGMGLNMDVAHVAFAGLTKFDGKRQRRLTVSEMAQIAGRAGRHQRDGSFGTLSGGSEGLAFTDSEIERIEAHNFPPLDHVFWRNTALDFSSTEELIASLEMTPDQPRLRAAPEAVDLAVLKAVAGDLLVYDRARNPKMVERLWDVCGLPDFKKVGADHHARLIAQLYAFRTTGHGHIPAPWFANELQRLDNVQGDVDTIAARIASVRTWAYIAHRPDWLANPNEGAARAGAIEEKLSDALHTKLTERFVDRRTTVLMRSIGMDTALLDVQVDEAGTVTVEDESIGTLFGFRFSTMPESRLGERKKLLAAAEARLPKELARRAKALAQAPDTAITLRTDHGHPVALIWSGEEVAQFKPGRTLLSPQLILDRAVARLLPDDRAAIMVRLDQWMADKIRQKLMPLKRIADASTARDMAPHMRAILANLVEQSGAVSRHVVDDALAALAPADKHRLRQLGIVVGTLDLFHPALLKPEAMRLRIGLYAAKIAEPMPPLPMPGLGLLDRPAPMLADAAHIAGFRRFGDQMLRIDLVERIARAAHDARGKDQSFTPDPHLAVSLGIGSATLAHILRALGFAPAAEQAKWRWVGRPRHKRDTRPINAAFSALAHWNKA